MSFNEMQGIKWSMLVLSSPEKGSGFESWRTERQLFAWIREDLRGQDLPYHQEDPRAFALFVMQRNNRDRNSLQEFVRQWSEAAAADAEGANGNTSDEDPLKKFEEMMASMEKLGLGLMDEGLSMKADARKAEKKGGDVEDLPPEKPPLAAESGNARIDPPKREGAEGPAAGAAQIAGLSTGAAQTEVGAAELVVMLGDKLSASMAENRAAILDSLEKMRKDAEQASAEGSFRVEKAVRDGFSREMSTMSGLHLALAKTLKAQTDYLGCRLDKITQASGSGSRPGLIIKDLDGPELLPPMRKMMVAASLRSFLWSASFCFFFNLLWELCLRRCVPETGLSEKGT